MIYVCICIFLLSFSPTYTPAHLCSGIVNINVTPMRCNTAAHCNTLQHTAAYCNTLQHTATHCNTLRHTAAHCNTLHHTAAHCNTLQHSAT